MNWERRSTSWGSRWVATRADMDFHIEIRAGYELNYRPYGDRWSHIGTFGTLDDAKKAAQAWSG